MDQAEARRRFSGASVARLATIRPRGDPHLVPITFATRGDLIVSAIDHKPKSGGRLARLENIAAEPRVTALVDHYATDWNRLWWVRADGTARVVEAGPEHADAVAWLAAKYPQYRRQPPTGPVISIAVERWAWWESKPRP